MGMNYYAWQDICKCCGKPEHNLHIGKSSWGWKFALHVIEYDQELRGLDEWKAFLKRDDVVIKDEDNEVLTYDMMIDIIMNRDHHKTDGELRDSTGYDGHNYGGDTYDLVEGDFC